MKNKIIVLPRQDGFGLQRMVEVAKKVGRGSTIQPIIGLSKDKLVTKYTRNLKNENKFLPISWIVRCQRYYVRIFEIEDNDFIDIEESKERGQKQRAYDDYMEKMFLDDKETLMHLDQMFNQSIVMSGTYKEYCDYLRSRGYEIKSKDNATKKEIKALEKELNNNWKKWRLKNENR